MNMKFQKIAAVALGMMMAGGAAYADPVKGFTGDFAPGKWEVGNNTSRPIASINGTQIFLGNDPAWGSSGTAVNIKAPAAGKVEFNYQVANGNDACPGAYGPGQTNRTYVKGNSGGKGSFDVAAGELIRFAVNGKDLPSDFACKWSSPQVTMTVTNFVFTPKEEKACWWMESSPPYAWKKNGGMPAKTEAECLRLDSCSPKGGKASGGGCYIWASDEEVKKATTPPPPPPKFCYWMESKPPYAWIKNGGMPAKTEAECVKLDSCTPQGGKASGGGCYKWATEAEMKAPPPAPKIAVKKAIYGENCSNVNKAKMDIAKFVGDACNGKVNCSYKIDAFKVVGDPAPNCPKELVTTYSCGGADKTHKLDKEAHGKDVVLDCSK